VRRARRTDNQARSGRGQYGSRVTDEPKPPRPIAQPEIKGLTRAACALVSMAGFVSGGIATFRTDNEIGTSALLLVGVLAGVITLLQRVPRIKWGDNELDPGLWLAAYGADHVADAASKAALEEKDPAEVVKAADAARVEIADAAWVEIGALAAMRDREARQAALQRRLLLIRAGDAAHDNMEAWMKSQQKFHGQPPPDPEED